MLVTATEKQCLLARDAHSSNHVRGRKKKIGNFDNDGFRSVVPR
jgi:hypothetical protein